MVGIEPITLQLWGKHLITWLKVWTASQVASGSPYDGGLHGLVHSTHTPVLIKIHLEHAQVT